MSVASLNPSKLGMVGRDAELRLLLQAWQAARGGERSTALLLRGAAGIGKSRLSRALRAQVDADGAPVLIVRCSPDHRNSALFPLVRRLRGDIGLAPGQDPDDAAHLLRRWVQAQVWPLPEALPLLACLLGVSLPAQERIASLSSGQRRQVHALLAHWLLRVAAQGPALLLADDLHWADPSTLEVLGLALDALPGQHPTLLMLMTARPSFEPPWPLSGPGRQMLTLGAFGASEVEALVLRHTGGKRLPAELLQRIHGLTDGVPLHVEELTKLLLESEALDEGPEGYTLRAPLDQLPLPASLSDSVQQRLARLPVVQAGRQVAQLGAAVGREFSQKLIEWLWTPAPGLLAQGLSQLVDAELLLRLSDDDNGSEGARYAFKHALVQEAAYASLETPTREQYHAHIAQTLLERQPDLAQRQPEVLAHHRTGAGQYEAAIPLWLAAADRAIETSAHAEGVAHVNRAVELLQSLPVTPGRQQLAATLQVRLGVALAALRGYAAEPVGRAYALAVDLAQQTGDESLRLPAHYGLWRFHLMRADYAVAHRLATELVEAAAAPGQQAFQAMGQRALASSLFYVGEFRAARAASNEVLLSEAAAAERLQALRFDVVDAWVTATSYRAWAEWLTGVEAAALADAQAAEAAARRLKHPFSLALSLSFAGWMHQFRGDITALRRSAQEALDIAHEHGFEFWIGWNEALIGWAVGIEASARLGAEQLARGIERWTATGSQLGKSYFLGLLAQTLLRANQPERALAVLDEAEAFVARTGERFWAAELMRLRALCRPLEAEALLDAAIELAQHQGALALVRRCKRTRSGS